MLPPLMKMNVAIKCVEVVSPSRQKQLLSDCYPQKQCNCSACKTNAKNNAVHCVARPIIQKEKQKASMTWRDLNQARGDLKRGLQSKWESREGS